MKVSYMMELFEYDGWANLRLTNMLDRAFGDETDLLKCEDERVHRIHSIAIHMIFAQTIWRSRAEGEFSKPTISEEEHPTPLAIRFAFGAERARFCRFLDQCNQDDQLSAKIAYKDLSGGEHSLELQQILTHIAMHSMFHRGQITSLLQELGLGSSVESTDISLFYIERQN